MPDVGSSRRINEAPLDAPAENDGPETGEREAVDGRSSDRGRGTVRHVKERADLVKERYSKGAAGALFRRLGELDIINRAMLFAAVMLLCFFPFLIVVDALAGRSAVDGLTRHLGLNPHAASDVAALFASTTATSNAVTGIGSVLFVLGGIAAASAIQELYERAFQLKGRGMKDVLRRLVWLGVLIGGTAFSGWAGPAVASAGGSVLLGLLGWIVLSLFWWFTAWFLLAGREPWRALLPTAIATSLFWIGMQVVFRFTFSGMVTSNHDKYGPIGVVLALMSWLIAIGVVIVLGAVVGIVWRERGLRFSAGLRRVLPRRRHQSA